VTGITSAILASAVEVVEKRQNVELPEHLGWKIPKSFFTCNPMVFFGDNHLEHG
jgi:hypothetical protein